MVQPVAARLTGLLHEDPSRATCSLVITGHSAGGAVATLLYAHMRAHVHSELSILTRRFKRVHCITFGTPPVSLLPIGKPIDRHLRKSLFLSFINEGDPVTRADKAYARSLLELYTSPAPSQAPCILGLPAGRSSAIGTPTPALGPAKPARPWLARSRPAAAVRGSSKTKPVWNVPPAALSNAGRLVLLRAHPRGRDGGETVRAFLTNDQQLRGVVFGDPLVHTMQVYQKRVDTLAKEAVLAKRWW